MRSLLLLIVLAANACAGPHPKVDPPAFLELGGNEQAEFSPFLDGENVTLVAGAQGGFHVWVRYRYAGASVEARLERQAHRLSDGAIVLRSVSDIKLLGESAPMPMFMCPSPIGIPVVDEPIVFSLRVSTESGLLAQGEVTLIPRCPDDTREFCQRICTG